MAKAGFRTFIILMIVFLMSACINPYIPRLEGYESLLVVEGLITDANNSNTVRLSRTFQDLNVSPVTILDATVFISDDQGEKFDLKSTGNGIYRTDSTVFRGSIGRSYVLHILTADDEEFESEVCMMYPVTDIDSIYIEKDHRTINNGTQVEDGVRVFLDSKEGKKDQYYRWTFDETWKFKVPNPKLYDYLQGPNPNSPIIIPVKDIKEFCWKKSQSDEILINSVNDGQTQKIEKQPVYFIATDKTDRLLIQYSILVKQYSLSKNEYEFWNNLKQVNKTGGDIFARQPYAVVSNIHSMNPPQKKVLGFFQVSAVSQKRKNIFYRDVALMGLHFYSYPCRTWEFNPSDFETICRCPPKTWDDVYWYLSIVSDYTFTQPKYLGSGDSILLELEFTRPECANCALTGDHTEPDFWNKY